MVNFVITDTVDTNLEAGKTYLYGIAGTYAEKSFMQGSIFVPELNPRPTFYANYSPDYALSPNLADIVGRYVGKPGSMDGSDGVTFDISGSGDITGSGNGGCKFSGTIKPRTSGNAYNITVTFGASPCQYAGATVNGVSYFDRASNIAYAMASISAGSAKFITIATKQ